MLRPDGGVAQQQGPLVVQDADRHRELGQVLGLRDHLQHPPQRKQPADLVGGGNVRVLCLRVATPLRLMPPLVDCGQRDPHRPGRGRLALYRHHPHRFGLDRLGVPPTRGSLRPG